MIYVVSRRTNGSKNKKLIILGQKQSDTKYFNISSRETFLASFTKPCFVLKKGKIVKEPDEYFEGTVRPDRDGKMKDIIEEIDEVDHLELKKIADEVDTLVIKKSKKASGGLAYMLGE